ncbi:MULTISPECIES: Fic family protein [Parabacteroides]
MTFIHYWSKKHCWLLKLSLSHRAYFRKHYLNSALQAELIAPKHPKPNHP